MGNSLIPLLAAVTLALLSLGPLQFLHAPEWVVWGAIPLALVFAAIAIYKRLKE